MEKLINLLNEFRPVVSCANFKEHYEFIDDDIYLIREWIDWEEEQFPMYVCYKKWKFIKWLVKNNKIDFRKLDPKLNDSIPTRYYLWTYIRYSFEKEILMTLSIQDNPIGFLCSVLK
jgi:hypothetical protein